MSIGTGNTAGYQDAATGSREVAPPGAAQVPAVASPEPRGLLGVVVAVAVVAALYLAHDVLIPITLAVLLSFVLSPVVVVLQRLRIPRAPAVILSVLAALGVVGALGTLIGTQVAGLSVDAPSYARTIETKIGGARVYATQHLASLTSMFAPQRSAKTTTPTSSPTLSQVGSIPTSDAAARHAIPVEVVNNRTSPLTVARNILGPVLAPLETLLIVLVVAIFILLQKEDLRDRFIRLFGSTDLHRTTLAMDDAGQRLSRYFLSQLSVNTSFGVVIGVGLWLIGIPAPAMWGILAGMLRFVPYIGSFLASLAPAALGAAIAPGWALSIEALALFLIADTLTGYVVEPLLYGHSTGLSPASVIVAAIFWSWLWGPVGLILSTPLTLCLVVTGRHVKSLEFFDVLLGDRPALTPVESFYQRVLANNIDEALAQAETLLEGETLVDYYDDVIVQGLRLATGDEARGTIDGPKQASMARSMTLLIDDLADHAQATADIADPGARSVACVAGRGPFDEAVTAMLAQLLGAHGVPAVRVSHEAVSREAIGRVDLSGVDTVAISYLELSGSPAHLRFLIRRLRAQAPRARIMVGLWPGAAGQSDAEARARIGADDYAGSLKATLEKIGGHEVAAAA